MTDDPRDASCSPAHVGQAGQGDAVAGKPTGQAGTGQSDPDADTANRGERPAPRDTATGSGSGAGGGGSPEDYDSDTAGGGGRVEQRHDQASPATGADAPSHGSR